MNRIRNWFQHFMAGRYGTDKLNMYILGTGVVASLLNMFLPFLWLKLLLTLLSYAMMIWAISRAFSRNTYKRYQENRKFLLFLDRLKDRQHKHYHCPRCRQLVRVPRGKGKIAIKCPKCEEKFIKKT